MRFPDIRLSARIVRTIGSSADVSSSEHSKRSRFCLDVQPIHLRSSTLGDMTGFPYTSTIRTYTHDT